MRPTAQVIELPQPSFSGKLPRKPRNKDVRSREYLTPDEVEQLIQSTVDRVTWDSANFAWPVDLDTGDTPNSLTAIFRKKRT